MDKIKELIKDGESADDLMFRNLVLLQHKEKYKFTSDAVLLTSFAKIKRGESFADFGTGSGVTAVLAAAKNPFFKKGYAVELQPYLADLARRNIELNGFADKISVRNCNINDFCISSDSGALDVVLCNPPYGRCNSGKVCENEEISIAKHEIKITLKNIIEAAKKVLKFGGRLYLVHMSDRLAETISLMAENGIEPKILQTVQAKPNKEPHLFLISGTKGGGKGIRVLKPFCIYNLNNEYTDEAKMSYNIEVK